MSAPEKVLSHTDPPDRSRRQRVIRVPANDPDPNQLGLLGPAEQEATLQENFERFHSANPHVYEELARIARRWKVAGHKKGHIDMFFWVLRYEEGLKTTDTEYKLNNNHRSRYSRLLMEQERDLKDFFEIRELQNP